MPIKKNNNPFAGKTKSAAGKKEDNRKTGWKIKTGKG